MSTDPDTILLETEDHLTKSLEHLKKELKSIRTGRASPAMIEFIKVEYYGSQSDLKALATISVPEPTKLHVKPFDAQSVGDIKRAIEASGLGLNPMVSGRELFISVPALSGDRRKQLSAHCKKLAEEAKVSMRNTRRDANKHADTLAKQPGTHFPEDEIERLKTEIQDLLKKYETQADEAVAKKTKDIEEI